MVSVCQLLPQFKRLCFFQPRVNQGFRVRRRMQFWRVFFHSYWNGLGGGILIALLGLSALEVHASPSQGQSTVSGSPGELGAYSRTYERAPTKKPGVTQVPASSSEDEDEPGLDPSLFPRIIDFGKVNSSQLEDPGHPLWTNSSPVSSVDEFVGPGGWTSDGSIDLVNSPFFGAPSPSPTSERVISFEGKKKVQPTPP